MSSAYDVRRVVAALLSPADPIYPHLVSPDLPASVLHDPDPMRIVRREGGTITPDGGPLTTAAYDRARHSGIDADWLDPMLSRYYAAWPFVEYGLFLALCYAVREALGDTIAFSIAFQAGDRMRHLQDIVHLMFDLAEAREGFTDGGARDAWPMTDPVLVPARENIERIVSCRDWFETVVAVNLVFEPIVGRLMKTELLARNAPRHGDAVTPLVLASANADIERHRAATAELVRLVLADPSHGDGNRVVLASWLDTWTAESIRAAEALAPLT